MHPEDMFKVLTEAYEYTRRRSDPEPSARMRLWPRIRTWLRNWSRTLHIIWLYTMDRIKSAASRYVVARVYESNRADPAMLLQRNQEEVTVPVLNKRLFGNGYDSRWDR
jgi:hypothetical protein